jgi:hypothetical protein
MNTFLKFRQTLFKFVAGTIWRYLQILKKEICYAAATARPGIALTVYLTPYVKLRSFSALREPAGRG